MPTLYGDGTAWFSLNTLMFTQRVRVPEDCTKLLQKQHKSGCSVDIHVWPVGQCNSGDKQKQDQWHYSELTIMTLRLEAWHARSWRCYMCWSRVKYCRNKPQSAVVQARDSRFKLSTMTRNCLTKVTEQIPSLLFPREALLRAGQ